MAEPNFNLFDIENDASLRQSLCGWKQDKVVETWNRIGHLFNPFRIRQTSNIKRAANARKRFLWQVTRKVLGKDTENYPQEIGDCTSFGGKNAVEYVSCCNILLWSKQETFRPVFPPYLYGCSRQIEGPKHGMDFGDSDDGSLGSLVAAAVNNEGVLFADENGVPRYSGDVAKEWGGSSGVPRNFIDIGKKALVKSTARITNWDDLVAAVVNGYPCTIASNLGFSMKPDSDGFHAQNDTWPHQMCIIGVDDEWKEPYLIILNSWGDAMGKLTDFYDNSSLPIGTIRAHKEDIARHLEEEDFEVFAYSQFGDFPDQSHEIDMALFDIIGN